MAKVTETTLDAFLQDTENANVGTPQGREMLARSFEEAGAGRSLLVDADGVLIAGNKSQEAALSKGLSKAVVVETDGTEVVVVKRTDLHTGDPKREALALYDNRTTEVGLRWDPAAIKKKFEAGLPAIRELWNKQELALMLGHSAHDNGGPESLDEVSDQLPGAAALKPDMTFPSDNPFEIPDLLDDMLSELPQPIDIWAGHDSSDAEWEGWWLYCYGSDSMRGLDTSRAVLAFYVDDYRFDRWWELPDVYVSKALNAGFGVAVSPNFSLYAGDPLVVHLYQVYKSRWLGRYMQEAGIPIIPDVEWVREEDFEFCFLGVPVGAPCISMQIQTINRGNEQKAADEIRHALSVLQPEHLLLYGGGDVSKQTIAGAIPDSIGVTWVTSRVIRRHDRAMTKPLTA